MATNLGGRPTSYDPKYCEDIITFFNRPAFVETTDVYTYKDGTTKETMRRLPNVLPTLERFAADLGVARSSLYEWAKVHKEFAEAISVAKEMQKDMIMTNGMLGLYNSPFAIFVAKNVTDMRDSHDVTSGGEKVSGVVVLPAKQS